MAEPDGREPAAPVRHAARTLVLDRDERILLMHVRDGDVALWCTPGGGIQPGELPERTAARELAEEIGLVVDAAELVGPVATSAGYADLGWAAGQFRDDYYFLRVDGHVPDTSGMEDFERGYHAGERWWTLAELAATDEMIVPLGLVSLLTDLLAGRVPARPVELPWHLP